MYIKRTSREKQYQVISVFNHGAFRLCGQNNHFRRQRNMFTNVAGDSRTDDLRHRRREFAGYNKSFGLFRSGKYNLFSVRLRWSHLDSIHFGSFRGLLQKQNFAWIVFCYPHDLSSR